MTTFFKRVCSVSVGLPQDGYELSPALALKFSGLRTTFKIKKDLTSVPNPIEVVVYNLSEASRSKIEQKGSRLIIEAGYEDSIAQIGSCDIKTTTTKKESVDWVTKIEGADGHRAINHARVNQSFSPGAALKDIITSTAKKFGISKDLTAGLSRVIGSASRGYVQNGRASDEISKLLKPFNLGWSIQDGEFQIEDKLIAPSGVAILLSSDSGMIGSPAFGTPKKKGAKPIVTVRSLLNHGALPGRQLRIESRNITGNFKIIQVTHTGDTAGNDWFTDFEGTPI